MKQKILILMATMLLSCISAYAQSNNNGLLKGDVNEDGTVDVADIVAVIDIMQNVQEAEPSVCYFYFGTTRPTATNYKTLSGIVTSYTSIDDAIGDETSVNVGQALYMLCPIVRMNGRKNVEIEDEDRGIYYFSDDVDAVTIPQYVIYKTQVWTKAAEVELVKVVYEDVLGISETQIREFLEAGTGIWDITEVGNGNAPPHTFYFHNGMTNGWETGDFSYWGTPYTISGNRVYITREDAKQHNGDVLEGGINIIQLTDSTIAFFRTDDSREQYTGIKQKGKNIEDDTLVVVPIDTMLVTYFWVINGIDLSTISDKETVINAYVRIHDLIAEAYNEQGFTVDKDKRSFEIVINTNELNSWDMKVQDTFYKLRRNEEFQRAAEVLPKNVSITVKRETLTIISNMMIN